MAGTGADGRGWVDFGEGETATGVTGVAISIGAGTRASDCASNRRAAARVRVYPAAYTARMAAELIATRLLATFFPDSGMAVERYRPLRAITEYAVAASLMKRPASDAGSRFLFIDVLSHAPEAS